MEIKSDVEPLIFWKLGNVEISFWWDHWTKLGSLANLVQNQRTPKNLLVKEFFHNRTWNYNKLRNRLPINVVNAIIKIEFIIAKQDYSYWMPDNAGNFTCISAWQIMRKRNNVTLSNSKMWHKKILFKISFFIMRALQDKVPTDTAVKRNSINLSSICNCCVNHREETNIHLLSDGNIAKQDWDFFGNTCGIKVKHGHLKKNAMKWWIAKGNNEVHDFILQCLPTVICQEIWKNIGRSRFENKKNPFGELFNKWINLFLCLLNVNSLIFLSLLLGRRNTE